MQTTTKERPALKNRQIQRRLAQNEAAIEHACTFCPTGSIWEPAIRLVNHQSEARAFVNVRPYGWY